MRMGCIGVIRCESLTDWKKYSDRVFSRKNTIWAFWSTTNNCLFLKTLCIANSDRIRDCWSCSEAFKAWKAFCRPMSSWSNTVTSFSSLFSSPMLIMGSSLCASRRKCSCFFTLLISSRFDFDYISFILSLY